jgi:hypothetical protein
MAPAQGNPSRVSVDVCGHTHTCAHACTDACEHTCTGEKRKSRRGLREPCTKELSPSKWGRTRQRPEAVSSMLPTRPITTKRSFQGQRLSQKAKHTPLNLIWKKKPQRNTFLSSVKCSPCKVDETLNLSPLPNIPQRALKPEPLFWKSPTLITRSPRGWQEPRAGPSVGWLTSLAKLLSALMSSWESRLLGERHQDKTPRFISKPVGPCPTSLQSSLILQKTQRGQ